MSRRLASPLLLTLPSGLVYALVLLLPLIGVAVLSLQGFDFDKGILPRWNLANYADLATDSLFREVLERTFRLSLVTTAICLLIGVPEAWIVHRMAPRWRGLMLLVVVGPLLVSVVVQGIPCV